MATFQHPRPVPVEDLGIDSSGAVWLGREARQTQGAEAARAGLVVAESADVLTLTDGAVATADALRRFARASEAVAGDVIGRLADPVGRWSDAPAFGPPARLVRLRGGGELSPDRLDAATPLEVPVEHRAALVPVADVAGGREVEIALSDAVVVSVHHYAGLLWANLLALAPALWRELVGANPVLGAFRLAWAFARVRSADPLRLAGALNRVERGARIHPSAVVEGAWVGPGARIGPGAVVRGTILGAGASVEPLSVVAFSVLGPGAHVQRMGWMHFGVLHPGSALAGAMQLGVLGPGASVKGGSYLMDQGIGQPVRARVRGVLVDAPLGLLGVGVGARTLVGSGVWIAPGRAVPPDLTILSPPDRVLTRVPTGISGVVRVRDGSLEPV